MNSYRLLDRLLLPFFNEELGAKLFAGFSRSFTITRQKTAGDLYGILQMHAFVTSVHGLCGLVSRSRVLRCRNRDRLTGNTIRACATVSREDVKKTARLARLELSEEEISKITPEFQKIISFIDQMSELDVDGVEPMARPYDSQNVVREDSPVIFPNV